LSLSKRQHSGKRSSPFEDEGLFVLTIALMLTRSFEIDSDGMGFGIADISPPRVSSIHAK
jgi:hypothetical protein